MFILDIFSFNFIMILYRILVPNILKLEFLKKLFHKSYICNRTRRAGRRIMLTANLNGCSYRTYWLLALTHCCWVLSTEPVWVLSFSLMHFWWFVEIVKFKLILRDTGYWLKSCHKFLHKINVFKGILTSFIIRLVYKKFCCIGNWLCFQYWK